MVVSLEACREQGLTGIAAAEVDCVAPELAFDGELLTYFPRGSHERMARFLRRRLQQRQDRMRRLVDRARERYDRAPTFEELGRFKAGDADPGDRLLAYAVADLFECPKARGVLPCDADYREFKSALTAGDEQPKPHAREVLHAALREGGFVVLAHPGYAVGKEPEASPATAGRLARLLEGMRVLGLWGAELYGYQRGNAERINRLVAEQASRLGLRCTWGSDCHGPGSPNDAIGTFWGDFGGFG